MASNSSRASAPPAALALGFSDTAKNDKVAMQFASRLSLIAFATVAVRGLLSAADFLGTIQTALVSLGVFYVLGLLIGDVARRVVEENAKADLAERLTSASVPGTQVPSA